MRRLTLSAAALAALLAAACDNRPPPDDRVGAPPPQTARLVSAEEVLAGANVPTLDPATMDAAEIARVLGPGPRCEFRYVSGGKPVLAVAAAPDAASAAVIKLNGDLVALTASDPRTFGAGPVRLRLSDLPEAADAGRDGPSPATLTFRAGQDLQVGYGGYYVCPQAEGAVEEG